MWIIWIELKSDSTDHRVCRDSRVHLLHIIHQIELDLYEEDASKESLTENTPIELKR